MISFTSLASSSKGNAYLVESPGVAPLLLDAGLSIKTLREKLSFGLSGLEGVCVGHSHMDHSRAVKDLLKSGIDVFASHGTFEALGVQDHHRANTMQAGIQRMIGQWEVLPFSLDHDAKDPLGFRISHGGDRLLFIPDTGSFHERFEGANIVCIECNHNSSILDSNVASGVVPESLGNRVRQTHLSLDSVIEILKAMNLSRCRVIYLLHLSDSNSDEKLMKEIVQAATGIHTEVC